MQPDRKNASVIKLEVEGDIATVAFNRPDKRNAVNDELVKALDVFFSNPPGGVKAVILTGSGGLFFAGLDLAEHEGRSPVENVHHSRNWHRVMDQIEFEGGGAAGNLGTGRSSDRWRTRDRCEHACAHC